MLRVVLRALPLRLVGVLEPTYRPQHLGLAPKTPVQVGTELRADSQRCIDAKASFSDRCAALSLPAAAELRNADRGATDGRAVGEDGGTDG